MGWSLMGFQSPFKCALFAQNGNNDDLIKESGEKERPNGFVNGDGGDFDSKKDRRPAFNFRWGELLDLDPENILVVGLTGLLGWASAQLSSVAALLYLGGHSGCCSQVHFHCYSPHFHSYYPSLNLCSTSFV
ncbi:hypothetical protein SLEP1_g42699 [Rubroshorea leprosula]|uniref:Uncharacterized protein n=1 Tax=Rubroshorea leprosula TaxID=152421 RepID=A0AAV5LAX5_9ROSI|nr:hypothetical protein SLEP1_g42699 [Rubroshorea leprosula]